MTWRIVVDRDLCQGHGVCESEAPEVFEVSTARTVVVLDETPGDDQRKAVADVDGAKVTVTVEAYDLDRTTVRVAAKKYGVNNGEIAKMVLERILTDLDKLE
jgi:ferredoxin